MSASSSGQAKRNRWLEWQPQEQIIVDSSDSEPTKPSKPDSVGFVGVTPIESPKIEAGPGSPEAIQARALLNRTGVRIMRIDAVTTIGVWSDLDGPEIRAALRTLGHGLLPVRYLEGVPDEVIT